MTGYHFTFSGQTLTALGSGALFLPDHHLLCVSDLHLGKSERRARQGAAPLPPYETRDTLSRLEADLMATEATTVICLGDSFDDRAAAEALQENEKLWVKTLQAGRRWVWIEGNHDPGPLDLGGMHLAEFTLASLTFRHIAQADQTGEISGHYHPKVSVRARGQTVTRPAFLIDGDRIILPAYGTYTGGLSSHSSVLSDLMRHKALAVLTGSQPLPVPMPRQPGP